MIALNPNGSSTRTSDRVRFIRTALAHHWLYQCRGGEKVLEQLCELFPAADIYCLVGTYVHLPPCFQKHRLRTSLLNYLPGAVRWYKQMLPMHPLAISRLQVDADAELIVVSDASMIKGLRVPESSLLVCYCHSPPRYLWEMEDSYKQQASGLGVLGRALFGITAPYCRKFDFRAAQRVDAFIANSTFVQERIRRYYNRESVVIHPPVDVDSFDWHNRQREDFYLVISELVPYKRIDLAIGAFNLLGKRLIIIGDGSERKSLEQMAEPNIEFLGRQPFTSLKEHYETCKALIFPGVEDFGITPVEAQAAGSPVIAFAQGGVLETVCEGKTGFFFHQQTTAALADCVRECENRLSAIQPADCRLNAEKYRPEIFKQRIAEHLQMLWMNGFKPCR
jgi:glycosyltransferase involved in cell wall biosynthesis